MSFDHEDDYLTRHRAEGEHLDLIRELQAEHAKPCICWNDTPLFIHDGHCCFREWDVDPTTFGPLPPLPCGHDQQDGDQ